MTELHERQVRHGSDDQSPVAHLLEEIADQSQGGPSVERPTAALFTRLLQFEEQGPIRKLVDEAAHTTLVERQIKPGAAVSAVRTSLIDYFRQRYQLMGREFSDIHRTRPEDWNEPFRYLIEDIEAPEIRGTLDVLHSGMTFKDASTPVEGRMNDVETVVQLARDRFPDGAIGLDIGSSIMLGALQLMHKREFPMAFRELWIPSHDRRVLVTRQGNHLLGLDSVFKHFVCVDQYPVFNSEPGHNTSQQYDAGFVEYALSGLRPSERHGQHISRVRALMAKMEPGMPGYEGDPGVTFHAVNMLNQTEFDEFRDRFPNQFDVITLNYVTQELAEEQQIALHGIAMSLLSENGLLIYNHQAYIPPQYRKRPVGIDKVKHYASYATKPYRSNMHYVDKLLPVEGLQQGMSSYDNRWRKVRVDAGKLVVNGAVEQLDDLIRHS